MDITSLLLRDPDIFLNSILVHVPQVLDGEVGDLLSKKYKLCKRIIPVSTKLEESLPLQSSVKIVELEKKKE